MLYEYGAEITFGVFVTLTRPFLSADKRPRAAIIAQKGIQPEMVTTLVRSGVGRACLRAHYIFPVACLQSCRPTL